MSWETDIAEIKKRRTLVKQQGGEESVERHHQKGRLTIRERISALLDPESFDEIGEGAGVPDYNESNELAREISGLNRISEFAQHS